MNTDENSVLKKYLEIIISTKYTFLRHVHIGNMLRKVAAKMRKPHFNTPESI